MLGSHLAGLPREVCHVSRGGNEFEKSIIQTKWVKKNSLSNKTHFLQVPCGKPCNTTTQEVLEQLHDQALILPTFSRASYSNLGFSLLGRGLKFQNSKKISDLENTHSLTKRFSANSFGAIV